MRWLLALLAGCGSASAPATGPRGIEAVARALERSDAAAVHASLRAEDRERIDPEEVGRRLADARAELAEVGRALRAAAPSVRPVAHARPADRWRLRMVWEGGRWLLSDGGPLLPPVLATPRDVVVALREALEARSLPALIRLLSRGSRAQLEAELAGWLEATSDETAARVDAREDEAVVELPGGRRIELVREGGDWRIVDLR